MFHGKVNDAMDTIWESFVVYFFSRWFLKDQMLNYKFNNKWN